MKDFIWAHNKVKLDRAVKLLQDAKLPLTEESVKERYVLIGGLVLTQEEIQSMEGEVVKRKPIIKRANKR